MKAAYALKAFINDSVMSPLTITPDEKMKAAYALNLCAVSVSQIIDSNDLVVLKQEREYILNNLNLQNFLKHPALLDSLKRILDTITYLEIQAGDMAFIEKEYQQKLKNAIWTAVPSPGAFFAGGSPVSIAIAVAVQVGTGYMNYRRNKNQYALDRERSQWELKRHEIEQLQGLRAQLFETAWKLSADFDFDDKFRLTEKQLSRFSEALLVNDPLVRYERLDVMSDKFEAFPPFWYYKGNAAMEVFRDRNKQYGDFNEEYKVYAIESYIQFHNVNFEFLRQDIIAASCCIEHISLLEKEDKQIDDLLRKAITFAGDNYDILQQIIFVNMYLNRFDKIVLPLREMIANDYNINLNGLILSRIYYSKSDKRAYEKLAVIAGKNNIAPWTDKVLITKKEHNNTESKAVISETEILEKHLGRSVYVNKFSMSEVRDWCVKNKKHLENDAEAVVFEVNIEKLRLMSKQYNIAFDDKKKYLVMVIFQGKDDKTKRASIKESVLINYDEIDDTLKRELSKGNGVFLIQGN